ncbi:bile acid:sodium symporter family protein [Wohlfahrtiimonas chitiniclastica]|uniref:bile acid:sodium symporter family protein n=1 Tax=Wohlfahrtiimonas chitiniclastica TaxID=400946 RepID=UPI001BD09C2B|nr:bile acid:sodium symporter family protein [Wohlfahrtiimonas chitiniclastica]MBS7817097.1 bile acid:sodium symporter family protein [Wohlfahrtiimonas chitiniclastica]MBS7822699.1 bile acid:sodium symporter family protein [Wohlfahrtiimonas chitiniclastica]MBS7830514.1 bile acid:sodium symporter family protein [Wohlfahrtiimonas chitiniclastica]MBS7832658.1 bile acid:sodium symporter family protein [Wohlfahrtiimonas chitiniclastica]
MRVLNLLSTFVGKTFAAWTLLFAVLGFVFPEVFVSLKGMITYLLGIIMFGMGLTLTPHDFSEVVKKPLQVLLGVCAQFIVMPLLALALVKIFNIDPLLALGIVLVGSCPGGTSSNVITYLSKGDVALSVTITSISTLLSPIMTPLLIQLLADKSIDVSFYAMMMSIVNMVIVPIVLGVIVRMVLRSKVQYVTPVLPLISVFGIVMIVAIVVGLNQVRLKETGMLLIGLVILHNTFGYVIGYIVARMMGLGLAQRKAIAIEVGMQNSGLGASLAVKHFDPIVAVPSAIFSVWHNISGAILANIFARMENSSSEEKTLKTSEKLV